jgi:hypothetical protein
MSPREEVQGVLVAFLMKHNDTFNAPYGVAPALSPAPNNGRGKVRTVTFGIAATLDATAYIWSVSNVIVAAQGPYARSVQGKYANVDELIQKLKSGFQL